MNKRNLKKLIEQLGKEGFLSWTKNVYGYNSLSLQGDKKKNKVSVHVYLVGGAVRDGLLGKKFEEIKDYDFVVMGIKIEELKKILERLGRVDLVGRNFGVLKFVPKNLALKKIVPFDIALPRKEISLGTGGYRDFKIDYDEKLGIENDLGRRDFTINALAYEIRQKVLVDKFHGLEDLEKKIIRTVGNARERFAEDYARMLRGIRFACQLDFNIEDKTWRAAKDLMVNINKNKLQITNYKLQRNFDPKNKNAKQFQDLKSWERIVPYEIIGSELLKAFVNNPLKAFDLYDKSGATRELLPELLKMKKCPQPKNWHSEGDVWQHTRLCLKNLGDKSFRERFRERIIFSDKFQISNFKFQKNSKIEIHNIKYLQVNPELVMAVLWHDSGKPVKIMMPAKDGIDRIRFNNHDIESSRLAKANFEKLKLAAAPEFDFDPGRASWLIAKHHLFDTKTIKEMKNATIEKYFFGEHYYGEELLKLGFIDILSSIPKKKSEGDLTNFYLMLSRINELKKLGKGRNLPQPLVNGHEVMKILKLPSGEKIGEILTKIRERQLSGKIKTKKEAARYIKSLA